MKSLLNPADRSEILNRIDRVSNDAQRQWGKMSLNQAICHITDPLRDAIGERATKPMLPPFIGRLFKKTLINEKPFKPNSPTLKSFNQTKGTGTPPTDLQTDKRTLVSTIHNFVAQQPKGYTNHPFVGKLTEDEWGKFMYKHVDHHLRQFGA